MELILISSNKLKIILTKEEMKKYKLNGDCNVSHMSEKKHFSLLLDDVKKRSGFDAASGSIFIELFESLRGGCEIFITKEARSPSRELVPASGTAFRRSTTESILTYKFTCAEDLILASKRLSDTDLIFESRLFSDEYGSFYLFLTFRSGYSSSEEYKLIFLEEYGDKLQIPSIRLHLDEHGKLICEKDATEILSKL